MSPVKPPTKECLNCHQQMPKARGVCPHCGYQTTWFKVRIGLGCISLLIAVLGMVGMLMIALSSE